MFDRNNEKAIAEIESRRRDLMRMLSGEESHTWGVLARSRPDEVPSSIRIANAIAYLEISKLMTPKTRAPSVDRGDAIDALAAERDAIVIGERVQFLGMTIEVAPVAVAAELTDDLTQVNILSAGIVAFGGDPTA